MIILRSRFVATQETIDRCVVNLSDLVSCSVDYFVAIAIKKQKYFLYTALGTLTDTMLMQKPRTGAALEHYLKTVNAIISLLQDDEMCKYPQRCCFDPLPFKSSLNSRDPYKVKHLAGPISLLGGFNLMVSEPEDNAKFDFVVDVLTLYRQIIFECVTRHLSSEHTRVLTHENCSL